MTGSSPESRPRQWSARLSDFLGETRNTELSHQDALAAAQAEHERVRNAAIRVFNGHQFQEEHRRLQEKEAIIIQQQQIEVQRIRNEERLRAEEEQLRALKAKIVPALPPAPSREALPAVVEPNRSGASLPWTTPSVSADKQQPVLPTTVTAQNEPVLPPSNAQAPHVNGIKTVQPIPIQPQQGQAAFSLKPALTPQQAAPSAPPTSKTTIDQYVVIHQNLKRLRASLEDQAKSLPPLKTRMGDMRRELRKCLGQIVTERGGNKKQIATIQGILQESLNGSIPSAMIDPSQYVTDQRGVMDGALHNEAQLPSLFLYLLNIFAKTIINQFINECGAQPKAADPLGVIAAQVFSNKIYLWRGKTLVDILMAKFRVACPVLFGYRGSEGTEQGRLRLGWRKEGGAWAPEQQHIDRMKGLAVGYAAISLRDFSKSTNTNPWPPSRYWTSLARIVNTPPAEISNTQCVVLRSMIEIYEERFISFYGSAAIAALRSALIDFPNKAPSKTPGTSGLQVLAQMLKRDIGLQL